MPKPSLPSLPSLRRAAPALLAALVAIVLPAAALAASGAEERPTYGGEIPLGWPEEERAFFQDGPALLLSPQERAGLLAAGEEERRQRVQAFLARDPLPATPGNELREGIERRRELVRRLLPTFNDDRARLLFLHGRPLSRKVVDCGTVFKPIEVWSYVETRNGVPGEVTVTDDENRVIRNFPVDLGATPAAGEDAANYLVIYQPAPDEPWRVWVPLDAKRALYTDGMEYLMQQWEELRGRITGRRPDLQLCEETRLVERATGVRGLTGYRRDRPSRQDYLAWLQPPENLDAWAEEAAATPLEGSPPELPVDAVEVFYPGRDGQRLVTRFQVTVPPGAGLEPATAEVSGDPQLRLRVEGLIEQGGRLFDTFRVRFRPAPAAEGEPLALVFERLLRPDLTYLVRLEVIDEVSEARERRVLAFQVPREPRPGEVPEPPPGTRVSRGEDLRGVRVAGRDNLVLLPPPGETVVGLWRATALVSGERIERVAFSVDGERQLVTNRRPFSAEVRLAKFPKEQVVRAEGYDGEGELVATDEVVVNRPRAGFRVRIVEPPEGTEGVSGTLRAVADVTVPDEKRLEKVEFRVNEELVGTLRRPPWELDVPVPADGELAYLSITAELADGTRTEAVRFLNAGPGGFVEELQVPLVEMYVAAQDSGGNLVRGLTADDFRVTEEGVPQTIREFELMDSLPLTVGFVIDTSGSMASALSEAQRAATEFLSRVIRPGDRTFAVAFADVPDLLMPPTTDVDAVAEALNGLRANGWTVLHDAVITALSYFREIEGQQALVLLSDGDDTASTFDFDEVMEYARRSEAAVYTVGLDIPGASLGVRSKLSRLAEQTGGRSFFIGEASELDAVYGEIEEELRSRYLVAYSPDPAPEPGSGFRRVEVEVEKRGVKTRTSRGYYP